MRIKSINTQKVLGSSDSMLRGSLLVEAVCVSLFACLLSLLFLYLAQKTPIASLVDADMSFGAQPAIIAGTAVIAAIVGVLAGLYPSYYIATGLLQFVFRTEITAFLDLYAHHFQERRGDRKTLEAYIFPVIVASPSHILVSTGKQELGIGHVFHA